MFLGNMTRSYIHMHAHMWRQNHENRRRLFPLFPHPGLQLFGLDVSEHHLDDACSDSAELPVPPVYTEREKGLGGAPAQSAMLTLNQGSPLYSWFINVKKPPLKGPWEYFLRTTTCCGSVNSHLWAGGGRK